MKTADNFLGTSMNYMNRLMKKPVNKIRSIAMKRYTAELKKQMMESQWLKEDMLQDLQLFNIKKLVRHAYMTTKYYRELFDGMGFNVEDIRSISDYSKAVPVLEKNIVRDRLEDLISSKWKDKSRLIQTSGSTGTPTKFYRPLKFPEVDVMWGMVENICGLSGNERTLQLWGNDLGSGRYHVCNKKGTKHRFSFYSMPPGGMEELLDFIDKWRPEFVWGYVSVLYLVAEELEKRGYEPSGVKVIQTHSMKLFDFQRQKIEKVFGGKVFEHYGSAEIDDFGVECKEHNGIHLLSNIRLFELESVGGNNSNMGDVLVTDFYNYAMPFLRYRIGDVLTIDNKPCPCGRNLPRAVIEGRTIDLIRLRDGTIVEGNFLKKVIDSKQVYQFLVHQRSYDRIDVHIVPTPLFTKSYSEYFINSIIEITKIKEVNLLLEKEIDPCIANKYRLIRSDVSSLIHN